MDKEGYYEIPKSMFWFWIWFIIALLFTVISMGILFILFLIPLIVYIQIKKTTYKYNENEFIIRKGIIFKVRQNIAIRKIEEVNAQLGVLTLIVQARPISLMYIKNVPEEADRLSKICNKSKI